MTIKIGHLGEQLVSQWLQSKSYRILHHSWRCRWGEIDIIAEEIISKTLVFVEVKTRSSNNWDNNGLEAISLLKQQKISYSAALFLAENPQYANFYMRFDVALVQYHKQRIQQHFENTLDDFLANNRKDLPKLSNQFCIAEKNGYKFQIIKYLKNAFEAN